MDSIGSVMEQTHQEPGVDEQRSRFPRKAIDPDAVLVAQLRGGDAEAAEALVSTYGDRVYRLAMRITGNASDAEEVVQDALWTASRKIDTFRGRPPSARGYTGSPPTRPTRSCGGGGAGGTTCHGKTLPHPSMREASMWR